MKKEHGTYSCATCNTALLQSSDRSDSNNASLIFTKPIDTARLQFKKNADGKGEREMRCKECKSTIGRLLDNGQYRAYSATLTFKLSDRVEIFEDITDKVEMLKEKVDAKNQNLSEQSNMSATLSSLAASASDLKTFLSGGVAGILIGAVGAFLVCRTTCAAPQTPLLPALIVATSTVTNVSTTSTSSRPRRTPPSASTIPTSSAVATTSAVQP